MKIIQEFKEFAVKGNVIDLAVGVIIGGAFGKIVTSLVNDIVLPPISAITRGINFSTWKVTLVSAAGKNTAVTLNYGAFLQNVIEFLIVAAAVFLLIKGINSLKRKKAAEPTPPPPAPAELKEEILLLKEIRDILKRH